MGTRRKLQWVALLYFAEGLPLGLWLDNLPVYFRLHDVSLAAIGYLSLLRAPWWAKVFWSPLVDQWGERRRWIGGALAVMAAALVAVALLPPAPVGAALLAVLLVFTVAAATQDVAIDAYTIELVSPGEEGIANSVRVSAYRVALVAAGGVLLGLAAVVGWPPTFVCAAALFATLAVVVGRLPAVARRAPAPGEWARAFAGWLARPGALPVFLFVLFYKLDVSAIGPMVKPLWVDRHLSAAEIAFVSTTLGVGASIAGAIVGGIVTSRWGIFNGLWILGIPQAAANLGYAAAAWSDGGRAAIYAASLGESFASGLGTAAFLSFLMNVCDKRQAATQYALLSALFSLSGSLAGGVSGVAVERFGYGGWFALTAALALPAYALLPWVRQWITESPRPRTAA